MTESEEHFFAGKKITLMGLGLLGRGVGVATFLAQHGAELVITDLKSKDQLAESIRVLEPYHAHITFVLGEHRFEDFSECDMVIKAAGVPLDSPYIKEAENNGIPVEMDASLFVKMITRRGGIVVIGITGTRGKSTTTHMIFAILQAGGKNAHLGGNVRGVVTLPLLEKVQSGDYCVLELDSWQLQGFGSAKISPHVAVFTTFLSDHLNYYKGNRERYFRDKEYIYRFQKEGDVFIAGKGVLGALQEFSSKPPVTPLVVDENTLPHAWHIGVAGTHNRLNAGLALVTAETLGISREVACQALEDFSGLPGRQEYIGNINGVRFFNDTCATTPDALVAALETLGGDDKKNTVLIMGGADKALDLSRILETVPRFVKAIALLAGSGSERIRTEMQDAFSGQHFLYAKSLEEAFVFARKEATSGDIILFSPGFASFGMFQNEFDRGDQFVALVQTALGGK